ncbi:hypothetical protein [Streptomyces albipurpureus]|uniref:Lipoprotein n=1 Tax=Streptomyces albipurpureus TaxID=2897419 RepID=A0ABT0UT35_9ACTN|nr:hypothetical protein [Streptomyces sp. CWNU-1]MCM2391604.1 hypothetical protein [Streptomyces sp. CWNU-1]
MTTSAKTLLAMVAWTASGIMVCGCVTVSPRPLPEPVPVTGRHTSVVTPQIVQGPAREALEQAPVEPVVTPAPTPPQRTRPTRSEASNPRAGYPAPRRPSVARPSSPRPPRPPRPPATLSPALPNVCALSEKYGGWDPSSPSARLCRELYGGHGARTP